MGKSMSVAEIAMLVTIVVYLVFMVYTGFVFSRSNESTSNFFLGGRKLGPIVTAMSAEASDMSSYLLMGLPAFASGILVNVIVSLLTQPVSKEITDVFDEVKSEK